MNKAKQILRGREAGFNLVEVSLAVAICAIGILTLIGLLPTGTDASRRACDDTVIASFVSDMQHWRRIVPFTSSIPTGSNPYFPDGAPALSTVPRGTNLTVYLDSLGNARTNEDGTINQFYTRPYFRVTSSLIDHPSFPNSPDIARIVIAVQWPCNPATDPPLLTSNATLRVFVSDYARTR